MDPAWVSSDPSVAPVSGGKVTGKALGATTIAYSAFGQTVEVPVTVLSWPTAVTAPGGVLDLGTLSGFDVSKASGWSGAAVKGSCLIVPQGGKVTYKYAFPGDIVRDLAFDVTVTQASIADCAVEVDAKGLTYTGMAAEPEVKVTRTVGDTTLTLTEGTDYTLSYDDNVNAGKAEVTVTGAGLYTGEKAAPFEIKAKNISKNSSVSIKLAKTKMTYTGKALKPKVTVKDKVNGKTVTLEKDKDYTVTYTNNKSAGKAKVTVKGKGNYTGTAATKYFTITKVKLTSKVVTLKYTTTAWTGKALKPKVTVKVKANGKAVTLKENRDYKVTYKNNKAVGTATVTVMGKGNFSGTIKKIFKITRVNIASAKLEYTAAAYTGKAIEPGVTVKAKVDGKTVTLKKGTDYTVTYKNNIDKGTATVTIKGKGNYTGTITKTFKIK